MLPGGCAYFRLSHGLGRNGKRCQDVLISQTIVVTQFHIGGAG